MKNSIIRFRYSIIALLMAVINGVGVFASTPWTVSSSDYRYDMALYLDVLFESGPMDYSQYAVGVFCGDECRGIADVLPLGDEKECLYLRARSNEESGETMTFKYYDKESEESFAIPGVSFQFESDGLIGYPSEPYIIKIVDTNYFDVVLSAGVGGSIDQEGGTYAEGTELTVTAIPVEGYSFIEWSDGITDNPRTLIVDREIILEAVFGANTYNAIFKIDDEVVGIVAVLFGDPIIAPEAPDKEGHTFVGWQDIPESMPAHDIEIIGTYNVNTYRLSLYLNEELYSSEMVEYGAPVVVEDPDVPEGMKFDGWKDEIPEFMPAADVDIHGTYSELDAVLEIDADICKPVNVSTLDGILLYEGVIWREVAGKLNAGLYIVDGIKVLVRK